MAELSQNLVTQYSNNCYEMAQQKGSKLSGLVTHVEMHGERTTLERVGETEAVQVNSRYDDSPIIHTPLSRRSLFGFNYVWGDMVDWQDREEILIDPTGPVTAAGAKAIGRSMDRVIIDRGIFGVAYEGKDGTTQVAFPDSQKVAITAGGGGSNAGLNLEKLTQCRSLIGNADIDLDDPAEKLYFVYTQKQMDDLVRSVDAANKNYEAILALYTGKTNTFLGFEFVRLSKKLIPATDLGGGAVSRSCFAFAKSCVAFGNPIPLKGRIAERADKNFNWYSHMTMRCGATRYEDGGVVHCACLEN